MVCSSGIAKARYCSDLERIVFDDLLRWKTWPSSVWYRHIVISIVIVQDVVPDHFLPPILLRAERPNCSKGLVVDVWNLAEDPSFCKCPRVSALAPVLPLLFYADWILTPTCRKSVDPEAYLWASSPTGLSVCFTWVRQNQHAGSIRYWRQHPLFKTCCGKDLSFKLRL